MAIQNKTVIITGASSGIGEATAKLLVKHGAKVVLGARREDRLKTLSSELQASGGKAVYRVTDVTKPADSHELVKLGLSEFGKVDAIFLNAGVMPNAPLSKLQTNEWERMVDVNLKGVINGIAAVLPTFIGQKSGHVLATSSVAGLKFYSRGAVYCATKWAVRALMEVLRIESAEEGTNIRTTTIYPAAINTELLKPISDPETSKDLEALYKKYGIGPESVANIVAFAIDQPENAAVSEFTVGPTAQPW
ncbi:MAG: SDR family oxidoreductase [Deltaproteobacteria bacterium]|jgi:NADP-dependent 3-hydroxy acid dehydrogenase YdfG|nr:SDR family oxidoreductase [Deltaproteobacteria bacterium]